MDDKTRPDETGYRFIGKPMPRKEDARLITGKGRFTDDFNLDGQTYAVMVRSPYPHARIVAIDAAAAKAMPGVLGVFTGADCLADKLGPIPHDPVPKTKFDMKLTGPKGGAVFIGPNALLPADKARHVGEAVAMVVAETKAQAMDAAEAVEVRYEELPFVLHSEDAMKPGAPVLWNEVPNNVTVETVFGNVEATDQAFARAAHVVAKNFHIGRVTGVPLEPRAALGQYDAATGRYTLYAGSGGAVRQKSELVQVLGIAPENLRVLSPDVGGNFGTRNRTFVEFGLVLWAAKKIGRPVKFTATRSEAFLSDYQGRDLVTKVELALDDKHRFIAMRATNISNVGARCVSLSPLSKGSGLIPGSYAISATTLRAVAVFTNTMPTNAYRSSGRPEVDLWTGAAAGAATGAGAAGAAMGATAGATGAGTIPENMEEWDMTGIDARMGAVTVIGADTMMCLAAVGVTAPENSCEWVTTGTDARMGAVTVMGADTDETPRLRWASMREPTLQRRI